MYPYISQDGTKIAPESMDKKYLVNALVATAKRVAWGGKNANQDDIRNIEALKAEIIRRITKRG